VTQYPVAVTQRGNRRLPTLANSGGQQFICAGAMIPHGDRRNGAVSGGAENEEQSIFFRGDDVVRVFVLGNCFQQQNRRLLPAAPRNELLQRSNIRQFAF